MTISVILLCHVTAHALKLELLAMVILCECYTIIR